MPSVAELEGEVRREAPVRKFRCLRGLLHGEAVFRIAACRAEPMAVRRRPSDSWIASGFFSEDLLDE
ncbi:MAG: hypothetical protein GXY33_13180 [Phycisphaerae bacterium]|nr:hypothetical protein [Phycisphaerae bacterium]